MLDAINTNIISLDTQDNLAASQSSLATSIQRLSSGLKINSAADDPAGLAIASRMTAQVNGLTQATQNANDGVSMLQTADGGLGSTTSILQSMRTLAVEAANGTNSASDLSSLQTEIGQLQQQINQISGQTQYNGINLLDGSLNNVQFQVGANANQTIQFGIGSSSGTVLGNNTVVNSATNATGTTAAATATALNGTAAGNLTVGGTTSQVIAISANESTDAIAKQINAVSNLTNVTATALTTATLGTFTAVGTQSISINGTAISAATTASTTNGMDGLTAAINAQTGATGVTAVADDAAGTITLTDDTGADISVVNSNAAGGSSFNLTGDDTAATAQTVAPAGTSTVGGVVTFNSDNSFAVTDATGSLFTAATPVGSALNAVSTINLTTTTNGIPTGANQALVTIDAAIQSVNTSRANLGALENRFTASISNLQSSTLNLTQARSTVEDTDFAAETANLSRGQILQQAGTAMLAQANALPNGVLALLR
jgi:flagellin